ncbi:MAG: hypothetical protein HY558_06815, partial [Euryarchaeota archaeon]|nr:hypothetical protein [Euryarchaeota archaeon]
MGAPLAPGRPEAPPGPAEAMRAYFADLDSRLQPMLRVAREARGRGLDPSPDVEIPVARDLA